MTVLEANALYRFHDVAGTRVPILRDVSFALQSGEFCTIMGPSGSGKSTLLHILGGLELPSAGEVTLAGHSVTGASEERRTRLRREHLGFIFQFFHLLPDLTVQQNVALPLMIAGEPPHKHRARIDEMLELLDLTRLRDRLPRGLSGGEMQRASIARALVTGPPLLLADEPTGNLSSKVGEAVVQLLKKTANETGTTVLLVTHNPRDAAFGDRVLFLSDGEMDPNQALTGGSFRAADVFRRLEELGI
ncbi:MAG: ABC transporter ATP-binding protein [Planctomycetota bacterium]